MSLTMRAPLRRIRRNLGALVDGVRGFADDDFSLRLHVTGSDEITDLVAVYNDIGDVLRDQRNESVQRELLFETVLQQFIDGYAHLARLPKPRRERVAWSDLLAAVQHIVPFAVETPPQHEAMIDRAQIEQVLINLVKNAREAGSAEADTAVRLIRRDGGSALIVEDRGQGMDDETLRHALLPFYSTKPGGTGLGLALAGEIIDAHGGNVRLTRREGEGWWLRAGYRINCAERVVCLWRCLPAALSARGAWQMKLTVALSPERHRLLDLANPVPNSH